MSNSEAYEILSQDQKELANRINHYGAGEWLHKSYNARSRETLGPLAAYADAAQDAIFAFIEELENAGYFG